MHCFAGLDVSLKWPSVCVVDADGSLKVSIADVH